MAVVLPPYTPRPYVHTNAWARQRAPHPPTCALCTHDGSFAAQQLQTFTSSFAKTHLIRSEETHLGPVTTRPICLGNNASLLHCITCMPCLHCASGLSESPLSYVHSLASATRRTTIPCRRRVQCNTAQHTAHASYLTLHSRISCHIPHPLRHPPQTTVHAHPPGPRLGPSRHAV